MTKWINEAYDVEDYVQIKEDIAATIFDMDYDNPDDRPAEATCHDLAEAILDRLYIYPGKC
jgi:hypothetical protein